MKGASAASTGRESYTSNMVYKLQLFIQEINGSLEETAQQVISTLPRLLKEVESLEEDARTIKTELSKAKKSLVTEDEGVTAVETLTQMHAIKERMESFYKSAHEVGSGNEVVSESEGGTSTGKTGTSENIDEIVARINALNQQLQESGDSITSSSPDIPEPSKGSDGSGQDNHHENHQDNHQET